MKRVYLFCDQGMSTSMMAQRMQEVADKHNLPIECKAHSYKRIDAVLEEVELDCILIGPQTKFLLELPQQIPELDGNTPFQQAEYLYHLIENKE